MNEQKQDSRVNVNMTEKFDVNLFNKVYDENKIEKHMIILINTRFEKSPTRLAKCEQKSEILRGSWFNFFIEVQSAFSDYDRFSGNLDRYPKIHSTLKALSVF